MENKATIFKNTAALMAEMNFLIVDKDDSLPWCGFSNIGTMLVGKRRSSSVVGNI